MVLVKNYLLMGIDMLECIKMENLKEMENIFIQAVLIFMENLKMVLKLVMENIDVQLTHIRDIIRMTKNMEKVNLFTQMELERRESSLMISMKKLF